jgi:hypothetical protein
MYLYTLENLTSVYGIKLKRLYETYPSFCALSFSSVSFLPWYSGDQAIKRHRMETEHGSSYVQHKLFSN